MCICYKIKPLGKRNLIAKHFKLIYNTPTDRWRNQRTSTNGYNPIQYSHLIKIKFIITHHIISYHIMALIVYASEYEQSEQRTVRENREK